MAKQEKKALTAREGFMLNVKEYEVVAESFGSYKKGDTIELHVTTAAPLLKKKIVK